MIRALLTVSLLFSFNNLLYAKDYTCPLSVTVEHTLKSIAGAPYIKNNSSWRKVKTGITKHHLTSLQITDGPPEEIAYLKPNVIKSKKAIYNFDSKQRLRGLWLVCMYTNTPTLITKALPKNIRHCHINLPLNTSDPKVHCR